jgi:L-lactate dehydrogenase (cytochrome)
LFYRITGTSLFPLDYSWKIADKYSGRQLEFAPSPLAILPEVIAALTSRGFMTPSANRPKFEVFIDGGVRRATDVLKAIALGATAVGLGRPMIYAMSTYGQDGVEKLMQILKVSFFMGKCRASDRGANERRTSLR